MKKELIGATLMVTGCCIGAGMIGLPVVSALTGFMPSIVAMIFCYLFTTATGLLLVEATLWFDGQVNLPTIMEYAIGKIGKYVTILLFLSLFYCIFVAYLDAGGSMFAEILQAILHVNISHTVGMLTCLAIVAGTVYAGTKAVDHANRYMLVIMIASYIALIAVGLPRVSQSNLMYTDWKLIYSVVPILLISFGYQNLVPSITYYLKRNVNAIRYAIIIGNFIPFIVYFLWNYVILGMLPVGQNAASDQVQLVAELLQGAAISSLSVMFLIKTFSLFAMLTSFMPTAASFVDFLKDGFRKLDANKQYSNIIFYLLVFAPPAVCTLIYPTLFLQALGFAGGFIDVLLFGVLPATAVLMGRSKMVAAGKGVYQMIGGYITPVLVLLLSMGMLMMKVL